MHVIITGRASPHRVSTENDGTVQRAYCRAGIKYFAKQGFFPGGFSIFETEFATNQSGYRTAESRSLLEVEAYMNSHPGETFLVVASHGDRFGRDQYNIEFFVDSVRAIDPNCHIISLFHFGLRIEQVLELIDARKIARYNANQKAKIEQDALPMTSAEKRFVSDVEEQVRTLTDSELREHAEHVPEALRKGMKEKHHYEVEVKSILNGRNPYTTIQMLHELTTSGDDDFESDDDRTLGNERDDDDRLTVQYFRQSPNTQVKMTDDDLLPLDQVMYIIAAMKVSGVLPKPDMILFDKYVKRSGTGRGFCKLIALIMTNRVKRVLVKSHERLHSAHMEVLLALCSLHNTNIVVAKQSENNLVSMATIELFRQEALRTTNKDFEDVVNECKNTRMDKKTVMIHEKLRVLNTMTRGSQLLGKQNAKRYKPQEENV